jgi:1,4-dihydroxy-2-naphthoate octaprenyltransferase
MNVWIEAARPRTLPAAVVPVAVGTAAGVVALPDGRVSVVLALLALVVALALQVAVNYANDLFDGIAGIDTAERVGPRRVVGAGVVTPGAMKRALGAALGVAGVTGLALAWLVDLRLLIVGVAAIAATLSYSGGRRPHASRGLGELSVFTFFGLVATIGSAYVQLGAVTALSVAASVPVGLLAVGLLMINNVRDVETDTTSGKRTLAVRLGARTYGHTFGWLLLACFALLPLLARIAESPWPLLPLLTLPLLSVVARRSREAARTEGARARGAAYVVALGATARLQLAFGLLLALGLGVSG